MALEARKVLVGAGRLYIDADGPPAINATTGLPTFPTGAPGADWKELGYTQGGLEVAFEPDYLEVEADQSKSPVAYVNQGLMVSFSTSLVEATLENLIVAWGFADEALSTTGTTFRIGDPDQPIERSVLVVGKGPTADDDTPVERLYYARRAISIEGSNHGVRRTEATVFPVTFRLLPVPEYAHAEYGAVIDRPGTGGAAFNRTEWDAAAV